MPKNQTKKQILQRKLENLLIRQKKVEKKKLVHIKKAGELEDKIDEFTFRKIDIEEEIEALKYKKVKVGDCYSEGIRREKICAYPKQNYYYRILKEKENGILTAEELGFNEGEPESIKIEHDFSPQRFLGLRKILFKTYQKKRKLLLDALGAMEKK